MWLRLLLAAVAVASFASANLLAQAQTKPCPPVTAKTATEAHRMEDTSYKYGCWQRDGTGHLVFVEDLSPDKNYKPILVPTGRNDPSKNPAPPEAAASATISGDGTRAPPATRSQSLPSKAGAGFVIAGYVMDMFKRKPQLSAPPARVPQPTVSAAIVGGDLAGTWALRCGIVPLWEIWSIARFTGRQPESSFIAGHEVVDVQRIEVSFRPIGAGKSQGSGIFEFDDYTFRCDFDRVFSTLNQLEYQSAPDSCAIALERRDGGLFVHALNTQSPKRADGGEYDFERNVFCQGQQISP